VLTISSDDLQRLRQDLEEADRRYNEALTALDRALQPLTAELPSSPAPFDEHQVTPLNRLWSILPSPSSNGSSGWRGRLTGFIWRIVGPSLQRQQEFNSALVDHINRNVALHRDTTRAFEGQSAWLRTLFSATLQVQSRLIVYLQTITWYVDTKDRAIAGDLRYSLEQRTTGLADGLSAVGSELLKRWETLGSVQQLALSLKRELDREHSGTDPTPDGTVSVAKPGVALTASQTLTRPLEAFRYVGFEDRYRGSREEIRDRMTAYLPYFRQASNVLDVGCGRGEFLELLREAGVRATGIDVNHEMVEQCRAAGLDVLDADALAYLNSIEDRTLGGLFAAQVVEHLTPDYLLRFLETAYHKMRPGSPIVLETINPACWSAFFDAYLRDITHVQPLHPDTLKYLLTATGYGDVSIRFTSPYPDVSKLKSVPPETGGDAELQRLTDVFNANVANLNELLFSNRDYAVIGSRL
jgi:2-polyprenyl-3-methyl-5-hydroxy-6-metoxy-1,4-benzoquinol methylase